MEIFTIPFILSNSFNRVQAGAKQVEVSDDPCSPGHRLNGNFTCKIELTD